MSRYYDKDGTPLGLREWARKFDDFEYRVIAKTYMEDDRVEVSTVWLGLNHQFGNGAPPIFETMVFTSNPLIPDWDQFGERYTLLSEAEEGHKAMVLRVRQTLDEAVA